MNHARHLVGQGVAVARVRRVRPTSISKNLWQGERAALRKQVFQAVPSHVFGHYEQDNLMLSDGGNALDILVLDAAQSLQVFDARAPAMMRPAQMQHQNFVQLVLPPHVSAGLGSAAQDGENLVLAGEHGPRTPAF
ncbi:MAG TPA: hypothetical protein VN442_17095 [Bryobacteraceae bacterium]|nr:hypothetical protein [Bryobacteraceae bacterium]